MKHVSAESAAGGKAGIRWKSQQVAAKILIFILIVAAVPLSYAAYGLAMNPAPAKSCHVPP